MNNTYIWLIWIISIAYCIYRMSIRYSKSSLDGITGNTPGFDMLWIIIFAPFLALIDLGITWYNKIYK